MNEPKATPIGDGIRAAIRESDQSVYKIAQVVGCSPQQLYNFLSGKRGLSLEILDGLAVALNLEVICRKRTPRDDKHLQPQELASHPASIVLADLIPAQEFKACPPPKRLHSQDARASADQSTSNASLKATALSASSCPATGRSSVVPVRPKINLGGFEGGGLGAGLDGFQDRKPMRSSYPGASNSEISKDDVRRAFGGKRGVIPNDLTAADPSLAVKNYNPDSAADPEPEHFNVGQADRTKMLKLWGPGVEAFYKNQKRDTPAKKNIYDFLAVLSSNHRTRKLLDSMKQFPMPEVLNWVQAFPPRDQQEIASQLPFLDDGLNDENSSVSTSFWDRVDKDSFYKAVEKSFGGEIKPDPHLLAKYVNSKTRNSVRGTSDKSDRPIRK